MINNKLYLRLLLIGIVLMGTVLFTSCNKDDDKNDNNNSKLALSSADKISIMNDNEIIEYIRQTSKEYNVDIIQVAQEESSMLDSTDSIFNFCIMQAITNNSVSINVINAIKDSADKLQAAESLNDTIEIKTLTLWIYNALNCENIHISNFNNLIDGDNYMQTALNFSTTLLTDIGTKFSNFKNLTDDKKSDILFLAMTYNHIINTINNKLPLSPCQICYRTYNYKVYDIRSTSLIGISTCAVTAAGGFVYFACCAGVLAYAAYNLHAAQRNLNICKTDNHCN